MITKKDIINMAKHVTRRSKGIPDGRIMHPVRDWLIGLLAATVVFVIGSIYAGFLFFDALNSDIDAESASVETTTYKHKAVNEALQTYRQKQSAFDELRGVVVAAPVVEEGEDDEETENGEEEDTEGVELEPNPEDVEDEEGDDEEDEGSGGPDLEF